MYVCVCVWPLTTSPFSNGISMCLRTGHNTMLIDRVIVQDLSFTLTGGFWFFLNVTSMNTEPVREKPANQESRWRITRFPYRKVSFKECLHPLHLNLMLGLQEVFLCFRALCLHYSEWSGLAKRKVFLCGSMPQWHEACALAGWPCPEL